MDVVPHKDGGEPTPLSEVTKSRFIHIERDFSAVVNFLVAMSQQAGDSGNGSTAAFWPAGSIRQLLEACTELGSTEKNEAAMGFAEKVFRELGSSNGVHPPAAVPAETAKNVDGKLQYPPLEAALRDAVENLSAAARAGRPALSTVDDVVKLLLPFVPQHVRDHTDHQLHS
jgi:hypothetical protein